MMALPNPKYNNKLKQHRILADPSTGENGIRASDSRWSWFGRSIEYTGIDGKKHYLNRTSALIFLKHHNIDTKKLSNRKIKLELQKTLLEQFEKVPELLAKAVTYNGDDQIALVKNFVSDITNGPDSFSIKKVEPGLTTGASGSPVFLVLDSKTNKLLLVVKISDPKTASKEAISLSFLSNLGIKKAQFPHLLKMGKIENNSNILIAQSAASGKPLEHFMKSVGDLQGKNRSQKFRSLSQIIKSSAMALSSLHNHKPKSYENKTATDERKTILEQTQSEFSSYIQTINEKKEKNPALKNINTNELIKRSQNVKFSSVGEYVHHDYHLGNVFYDEESSEISIIDNDGILDSVDSKSKAPIGVGAQDAVYFMQWIAIQGQISNLTVEEIQNLQKDFLEAYINSREGVDENFISELEFMKIFIPAKYICDLQNALETPDHPWNKSLGEENLSKFIQHLANYLSNPS